MKKKIITIIMILTMYINIMLNDVYAAIEKDKLNSTNVGVYNLENMELLYGQNIDEKISIASITKVMTAIVTIENISDINDKVIIDYSKIEDKIDSELAVAGIENNEELTYYDLLCTMLIPSGADSAIYLANIVFENEEIFIQKMNEKAKELEMYNTNFSNVTGLDDEENFSTISDLSKMMKYALKNDTLKEIMSLKKYTTSDNKIEVESTISKSSSIYGIDINYIMGGKTGTTENAGLCLASYAKDDGTEILAIVTGSSMYSTKPYNIIDSEYLYDEIINNYSNQIIIENGEIIYELPSTCTKQESVNIYAKDDILAYTDYVDKENIKIEYSGLNMLDYTIKKGEKIGEIKIYYNNTLIKNIDVTLDEKLNFSVIKWANMNKGPIIILALIIGIISVLIRVLTKSKKSQ